MATGIRNRSTLLLVVLALIVAGIFGLVATESYQPLTGDWHPTQKFEGSGVRMQLQQLTVQPWSQVIPMISEHIERNRVDIGEDQLFLLVEFSISVDGTPIRANPGKIASVSQSEVQYNGKPVKGFTLSGTYSGKEADSIIEVWCPISPWHRGFGAGEFSVRKTINLKDGEKVTADFQVPAR